MRWTVWTLFFFASFFSTSFGYCSPTMKVALEVVRGEHALSLTEAKSLFAEMQIRFKDELGVELVRYSIRARRNPFRGLVQLENRLKIFYKWWYFFNRRYSDKSILHLALIPPLVGDYGDRKMFFIVGYAAGVCPMKFHRLGVSYVAATSFSEVGLPRFMHSLFATMHELGHLLGASHDEALPASLMNPDIGKFLLAGFSELRFSARSVSDIQACLGKKQSS